MSCSSFRICTCTYVSVSESVFCFGREDETCRSLFMRNATPASVCFLRVDCPTSLALWQLSVPYGGGSRWRRSVRRDTVQVILLPQFARPPIHLLIVSLGVFEGFEGTAYLFRGHAPEERLEASDPRTSAFLYRILLGQARIGTINSRRALFHLVYHTLEVITDIFAPPFWSFWEFWLAVALSTVVGTWTVLVK